MNFLSQKISCHHSALLKHNIRSLQTTKILPQRLPKDAPQPEPSPPVQNVFDPHLLSILVCPLAKTPLRHDAAQNTLVCDQLGVSYPIVDGIPQLVPWDGKLLKVD
eukprot:Sdes_comp15996_c0_seq1m5165